MKESDNATPHLSSEYDKNVRKTIPYYECFHTETINFIEAAFPKPRIWLDTGGGTGFLIEKALARFRETTFILADPSPEMLQIAKNKLGKNERVKFLDPAGTQDLALEFKMDVITAIQAHHYLTKEEREKATKVCFDLLAPNGIYITFENIRPLSLEGVRLGKAYWSSFQLAKGRGINVVNEHMNRFDSAYFPITIDEHLHLLKACGFRTAELFWYSYMQAGFYGINPP